MSQAIAQLTQCCTCNICVEVTMSWCASKSNGVMLVTPQDLAPDAPAIFFRHNIYEDFDINA